LAAMPVAPSPDSNIYDESLERRRTLTMDNVTIIRVVAGVLFVIVLVVLIQRRRTRVK
jgi:plasmid stabilization system protein ParE